MPRAATIGPEIYERVNALVAEGKTRTEAFKQIGEERGSRAGTVAANYYRVARATGKPGTRAKRSTTRSSRAKTTATGPARTRRAQASSRSTAPDGDIGQIAQQIAELTQQLVRQVKARDDQLRKLLG
jgi:hypothetical protein